MKTNVFYIRRGDGKYYVGPIGITWSTEYIAAKFFRTYEEAEKLAKTFPGFIIGNVVILKTNF